MSKKRLIEEVVWSSLEAIEETSYGKKIDKNKTSCLSEKTTDGAFKQRKLPTSNTEIDEGDLSRCKLSREQNKKSLTTAQNWIGKYIALKDMILPCVLQLVRILGKEIDKGGAQTYIISFIDATESGVNSECHTRIPAKVVENPHTMLLPGVIVYFGKRIPQLHSTKIKRVDCCGDEATKDIELTHHFYRMDQEEDVDEVLEMARLQINMTDSCLEELYDVRELSDFSIGTAFLLEFVKLKRRSGACGYDQMEYPVARFKTVVGGVYLKGLLSLPVRHAKEAIRCMPCIMIYKGKEVSSEYKRFNVTFVSESRIRELLQCDAQDSGIETF